jgi:hypothetical protein
MICELLKWKCNFFDTILSLTLHSDGFCKNQIHLWHQYYPLKQCPSRRVEICGIDQVFRGGNVLRGKVNLIVIRLQNQRNKCAEEYAMVPFCNWEQDAYTKKRIASTTAHINQYVNGDYNKRYSRCGFGGKSLQKAKDHKLSEIDLLQIMYLSPLEVGKYAI